MLGYPDLPTSIQVIQLMLETGVDAVEIGIPFTDPLADGVVIQAAAQKALESGVSLTQCLEAVRQLRVGDQATPFLMMGYLNPFMAYGLERLTQDAAHAGVDGFIIPDLPPDEASEMLRHTRTHQLALIELLAPTSNVERIRLVASTARGFIYLVSVTGVTGARTDLPIDLSDYIQRVRAETKLPLAVGFGVSNAQHAAQVSQHADGVIVASALIREYNQNGLEGLQALLKSLKNACKVQ
jgi:tryptophan synthase alpha chain